jgi:hypothetical protein
MKWKNAEQQSVGTITSCDVNYDRNLSNDAATKCSQAKSLESIHFNAACASSPPSSIRSLRDSLMPDANRAWKKVHRAVKKALWSL